MPIRIACTVAGYEDCFIEYRDEPWPFKDRRLILGTTSDISTLELMLSYMTGWNLRDVEGKPVSFGQSIDALDNLDDTRLIPWIITSWFHARAERSGLPKAPSPPSINS